MHYKKSFTTSSNWPPYGNRPRVTLVIASLFCHVSNNCFVNTPGKEDFIFLFKVTLVGYELKEIGNERYPDGFRYCKDGGNFILLVEDIFYPDRKSVV